MANGYRNALVQQIKDAGQELINRAESMVHPENDCLRSGYLSERRIQCLKNMMNIWKNTGKL